MGTCNYKNMKKFILCLLLAASTLTLATASGKNTYDLRCEGMTAPLGIDSNNPHFSWKNDSIQETYRIQVASSQDALLSGNADLWDSGTVRSDESVMVAYSGKELLPPFHREQLSGWRSSG